MERNGQAARISILIQAVDRVVASAGPDGGSRSERHLKTLAAIRASAVAELADLEAQELEAEDHEAEARSPQ